ncbi:hypothetical protein NPIL_62871, partial [Nephila pilipes]
PSPVGKEAHYLSLGKCTAGGFRRLSDLQYFVAKEGKLQ